MSFQIAILKILSSYSVGRASSRELKADLALLQGSGADSAQRHKRLAAFIPDLDIFQERLVLHDVNSWQITEAGYNALIEIEFAAQVGTEE